MNTAPAPMTSTLFNASMPRGKFLMEKRIEEARTKNEHMAWIYLAAAILMLGTYSYLFLYPQITTTLNKDATLASINKEIENYDKHVLPDLQGQKTLHKAAYDAENKKEEDAVKQVFPGDTDMLGITKLLENFAQKIDQQYPPFSFNSINFDAPVQGDGAVSLPMSMSISTSRENFARFLQLIDFSGNLKSDPPVRLMEISNISVHYRGVDPTTLQDLGVDFSAKLNAYSRQ